MASNTSTTRLEAGMQAPDFTATDHDGAPWTSKESRGTSLVVYFYPRAFTPGCTTESCDFRDRHDLLAERGYEIIGISPDPPDKLAEFREQYDLPFTLLSDPDHEIASAFGAFGIKKNYGKEYEGVIRSTFLIDEEGTITEAFYNVRAKGHAEQVASSVGS
jgi:peroxiredoxin Q/BCP